MDEDAEQPSGTPWAGGLAIHTTDLTTDGRFAKIRGHVENTHAEVVHGIRYVVVIVTEGDEPRELDSFQYEVDTTVEPGARAMMRLDVESMYFGMAGATRFFIGAFPKKVGDRHFPLPPGWRGE